MAGLNVNMTDDLRHFVDERIGQKGFSTPTEYVRQLIREDRDRAAQEKLEQLLLEGIQSGESAQLTPERLKEIRQRGLARLEARRHNAK